MPAAQLLSNFRSRASLGMIGTMESERGNLAAEVFQVVAA